MAVSKEILDLIPQGCKVNWNEKQQRFYVYKSTYYYRCEDVCFCLSYRKISRKWAFNLKAEVVWNAPGTSEELWKKFTAYGLGGGESGFADFDNYQNYQYFFNTKTLPIELNNLQILPPLFYGNIMGRNLRGEFDKRQGSNKLLLLFINKSLYFSNSSRSIQLI